jgi:hypothetical protein
MEVIMSCYLKLSLLALCVFSGIIASESHSSSSSGSTISSTDSAQEKQSSIKSGSTDNKSTGSIIREVVIEQVIAIGVPNERIRRPIVRIISKNFEERYGQSMDHKIEQVWDGAKWVTVSTGTVINKVNTAVKDKTFIITEKLWSGTKQVALSKKNYTVAVVKKAKSRLGEIPPTVVQADDNTQPNDTYELVEMRPKL